MVYHEEAFHDFFIPCHRNYTGQNSQCGTRAAHDGKVKCNTVEYTRAFLNSDWLYFLLHGVQSGRVAVKKMNKGNAVPII